MFRIISLAAVLGTVAAIAVHYLAVGPKHPELRKDKRDVRRFSLWERLVHAGTLFTFLTLAVSGFGSAVALGKPVLGWWGVVHVALAPGFAAGVAAMTLTWAQDCCFRAHDWAWAKGLVGYLRGSSDLPAGRFTAEEKARLWGIALLAIVAILSGLGRMHPLFGDTGQRVLYETHRYGALLLVLSVIVHAYLRSLACPGTLFGMVTGKVSANWAKHHRSAWWESIQQQHPAQQAQQEPIEPRPEP